MVLTQLPLLYVRCRKFVLYTEYIHSYNLRQQCLKSLIFSFYFHPKHEIRDAAHKIEIVLQALTKYVIEPQNNECGGYGR